MHATMRDLIWSLCISTTNCHDTGMPSMQHNQNTINQHDMSMNTICYIPALDILCKKFGSNDGGKVKSWVFSTPPTQAFARMQAELSHHFVVLSYHHVPTKTESRYLVWCLSSDCSQVSYNLMQRCMLSSTCTTPLATTLFWISNPTLFYHAEV